MLKKKINVHDVVKLENGRVGTVIYIYSEEQSFVLV